MDELSCQHPVLWNPAFCEDGQYMFMRPRVRLMVATAMLAGALWSVASLAATAPVCGTLCGKWQLDAARSDDVKALLDSAMATFKEPRPRRQDRMPRTLEGDIGARVDESLGPINTRPFGTEVRRELDRLLTVPGQLVIELQGREFRLGALTGSPRRLTPGESHARVDARARRRSVAVSTMAACRSPSAMTAAGSQGNLCGAAQ